ncbi:MAG TPA: sigma 54-interacting transcriptional regulator [Polyangiales bacterium]|nr:sigma 54-interacting transcriptional regulator [Polyangiales bacterium]
MSEHTAAATITQTIDIELAPLEPDEDPTAPRLALVIHTRNAADVVRLRPDSQLVVGRDFPAQLRIDDPLISRQHARFSVRAGVVRIEDLDSRNGTHVNAVRISRTKLAPGDEVMLGRARIALIATRGAAAPESEIVMRNPRVIETYALAKRAARADVPVLVLGETGTGKEHLAHSVHVHSPRSRGTWHAINCGTIPNGLVESVLFGHERGAFTGAERRNQGMFEAADGGTLFLDEVAELPASAQTALLRVLETGTFRRVGGNQDLKADVRVIAATHCDLNAAVAEGSFRADLLYRIDTIRLELPPLRERLDEIEPLAQHFLASCRQQWAVTTSEIEDAALARLQAYDWPGNIRQLRNAIERAALIAPGQLLRAQDLPAHVGAAREREPVSEPTGEAVGLKSSLREFEARVIRQALEQNAGNRRAAARMLRVPMRTLYRRMQQLGVT